MNYLETVYIERENNTLRIALKDSGKLIGCFIEEDKNEPVPGEIYKGIVKNIIPAIKCAFIDIGFEKNAYMYLHRKFKNENIKKGDEVLVEVMKEAVGEKGPKVTNLISIPGRYSVIITNNNGINFSKKILGNDKFKEYINKNIIKPADVGIMIRTNALNVDISYINEEISYLYEKYNETVRKGRYSLKPGLIYDGGGALGRIINDVLSDNTEKVILNRVEDYDFVKKFIKNKPDINLDIELYSQSQSLFSYYNIEREILALRNNKVTLPSGGNIVIEKTEAMYVIDVNSGKNVNESSIDKTAMITNFEAAKEISKQIMMRNLSGIIIIDFIDMDIKSNKMKIIKTLKEGFKDDKKKTVIYPFTELNLIQIARKRRGKSIYDYIEEDCSLCHGKGKRIKLSYINKLIKNEIIRINDNLKIQDIYIEIDKIYEKDIRGDVLNFINEIDCLDKRVYVNFMDNLDYFNVQPLLFASQINKFESLKIYG